MLLENDKIRNWFYEAVDEEWDQHDYKNKIEQTEEEKKEEKLDEY